MSDTPKSPSECQFGIIENNWGNPGQMGIFISFMDGENAFDGMYYELLTTPPDWLPESEDAECYWTVPNGMTREQIMTDMIALGYTHKPEWDADMT